MKKFFKYLVLVIFLVIVLSFFFDLNTAHIEEVKICDRISGSICQVDKPIFETNTPQIYVSCELKNPPGETQVQFSWYFIENERTKIDSVVLNNEDEIGNVDMYSSLNRPNNGWPKGDYEVIIKILDTEKDPIVKSFYVR